MKLRCLPVEPDRGTLTRMAGDPMILAASVEAEVREQYANVIAFAPPPPADIAEALELAKQTLADYAEINESPQWKNSGVVTDEEILARAILRSWGRE